MNSVVSVFALCTSSLWLVLVQMAASAFTIAQVAAVVGPVLQPASERLRAQMVGLLHAVEGHGASALLQLPLRNLFKHSQKMRQHCAVK